MYCKECGKEIANDSKFCNHCGAKQSTSVKDTRDKKIVLEVPEVIIKNKIPKNTKIFIGLYTIYLFCIFLYCISESRMSNDDVLWTIIWATLPVLIVLVRYLYRLIKQK